MRTVRTRGPPAAAGNPRPTARTDEDAGPGEACQSTIDPVWFVAPEEQGTKATLCSTASLHQST